MKESNAFWLYKVWLGFTVLVLALGTVTIPYYLAFHHPVSLSLKLTGLVLSLVLILDFVAAGLILQKRGPFAFLPQPKKLAFVIDLIAALPLSLVFLFDISLQSLGAWELLLLVPLVKLLRVGGILRFLIGPKLNPAIFRLAMLVFTVLVAEHFISCWWILLDATDDSLTDAQNYLHAFYWTTTTIATVGYGDIIPKTDKQMIFTIVIELFGAGMFGLIIGNIANLIASIDVAKAQHREKVERITDYLNYKKVPSELRHKVLDYFDYLWESRRGFDEMRVSEDLPEPLKVSLALQNNSSMIAKVPFFQNANPDFLKDILLDLKPVIFPPHDNVFSAGELGHDMYFIGKGSVDVVSSDGKVTFATLREGQFFGEIALLFSSPRTATIRTNEYCDLYRLDRETFERILGRYTDFKTHIGEFAEKRRKELGLA